MTRFDGTPRNVDPLGLGAHASSSGRRLFRPSEPVSLARWRWQASSAAIRAAAGHTRRHRSLAGPRHLANVSEYPDRSSQGERDGVKLCHGDGTEQHIWPPLRRRLCALKHSQATSRVDYAARQLGMAAVCLHCADARDSKHRHPHRRGDLRRKRPADLSRRRRAVGGASGRGCRDPAGLRPRSRAGPPILRRAARAAGRGRAQCRACRAGAARRRMAGRLADRHAECRRPARAGGGEAAAPHARRVEERLVPALRRALRVGGADGRGRRLPVVRNRRAWCAPTSSGSARCPTRWSGSRRR